MVRKHRVGSSPTSGTRKVPAKVPNDQNSGKGFGENLGSLYTNYYTNALRMRVFHRSGGAVLHE